MKPVKEVCVCVEQLPRVMEMLPRPHVIWPTINVYVELIRVRLVKRVWVELVCVE